MPNVSAETAVSPQYIALPGAAELSPQEDRTDESSCGSTAITTAANLQPENGLNQRIGALGQVLLRLWAWKDALHLDEQLSGLEEKIEKVEGNRLRGEEREEEKLIRISPCQLAAEKSSSASAEEGAAMTTVQPELPNRRKLPRHTGKCRARVYRCREMIPLGGPDREWLLINTRLKGPVYDISLQAVAIILPVEIDVGETLLLRLENRLTDYSFDAAGTVVRTVAQSDGSYLVACELKPRLTLEDISQLGWASPATSFL